MPINTIIWATDNFNLDELKDTDKFVETHFLEDSQGYWNLEFSTFDNLENVELAFKFLFGEVKELNKLLETLKIIVFDLNDMKKTLSTFEELENWYQDWIAESKRENSMDEYGQFIGLISYIQRNQQRKHLIAIVEEV